MAQRHATLREGNTYQNKGGGRFMCLSDTTGDITQLQNVASGWRFSAHCVTMYDDGTIEWDFSTGGRFAEAFG